MGEILLFDSETDGLLDTISTIHTIVIYSVTANTMTIYSPAHRPVEEGVKRLQEADLIVAHNGIQYDVPALQKIYPWFAPKDVGDTLVLTRLLFPNIKETDFNLFRVGKLSGGLIGSHSLEAWGRRVGEYKDNFRKDIPANERFKQWGPDMDEYCVQDVWVLKAVWERCQSFLNREKEEALLDYTDAIGLEYNVQRIIGRQIERGFWFDVEEAERLHVEWMKIKADLVEQLRDAFPPFYMPAEKLTYSHNHNRYVAGKVFVPKGNNSRYGYIAGAPCSKVKLTKFNPTSSQHIIWVLQAKYGWEPVEFTEKSNEPAVSEEVLEKLEWPEAKLLHKLMTIEKRLGQLASGKEAWLKHFKSETHCIHGYVNTMGTVTYRMSHSKPNVAQVPASRSPFGHECRALFRAREGYVLVGCDAEGLEARCLAHFLARYDNGAFGEAVVNGDKSQGTDVHTINMRALEIYSRDDAKTWFYAFIYGAGDEKLGAITHGTKADGKKARAKFLKNLPALGALVKAVQSRVRLQGWIKGLDGRKLYIRSAHSALNTLLQSAGAIIMKRALVLMDAEFQARGWKFGDDYEFVVNVHDEVQIEAREGIAEEVGRIAAQAITDAGDYYEFRCRLDGDYAVGLSWAETH